jgi:hypothetical protein
MEAGRYRRSPTGRIEDPKFVRGFDPLAHLYKAPPRPSPWRRHFELGRQNPAVWNPSTQRYDGGWMLVAEAKKGCGGPKARSLMIQRDREQIRVYLDRHHPLERWQTRQLTISGTWADRELYLRFLGELSPEENILDRKRRAEVIAARLAQQRENKARREAAAREKARLEEAAAQAKIRARRRPGH